MQNKLTENETEENTTTTSEVQESNSQKETTNMPIIPLAEPPKPLTMNDVDSIEDLYNAYINGKVVDFPPWIVRTEKGLTIIPQELFIHISETQDILSVKLGNSKGILLYKYEKGVYKPWTDSEIKADIKGFMPRRIREEKHWNKVIAELKTEYTNIEECELNADEKIINFKNRSTKH